MALQQIPVTTINSVNTVPVINAAPQANTTGAITTATTTIVATDLNGVGSASVQFSGTFVGVNVTFETSTDAGTTWFPTQAQNQSTGALTTSGATGVLPSSTTVVYTISPLLGQSQFRVRATAFTSGSAAFVIHPSTQFVPLPVASQTVNGTVSSGVTSVIPGTGATNLAKAEDAPHVTGDTGVAVWAVRNDNVSTTHTSANGDYSPFSTDGVGTQYVREAPAITSTITQVTPATTTTTIKASNPARKSIIIMNGGTSDCYIAYGSTSATTAYTFLLPSLGTTTIRGEEYSGLITGIWTATGGNAMQVTEII